MAWKSGIYEGWVRHRRFFPTPHEFRYRTFHMYLDLDELPHLFRGMLLWGADRRAWASIRRKDFHGDPKRPLADCIRDLIEQETGRRPSGPIRMLTQPGTFGVSFNPVVFYWCYNESGDVVENVVAEVTNTPWKKRHCYVLDCTDSAAKGKSLRLLAVKRFHVSPFMGMDKRYLFALSPPGRSLVLHMNVEATAGIEMDATLSLQRREIDRSSLLRTLLKHPVAPAKTLAAIYWQAWRLWRKGCPFHPHPGIATSHDRDLVPATTPACSAP
ncbi:MAG: DUF1365 domain-containing protein [Gemmataceae bacterium]|nr:DUF1365 domain-containing protein [Gemmataceae bacterium]